MDVERLYTIPAAAELLGLQPSTLRAWRLSGLIEVVRVGKRAIRVPARELTRLVETGRMPRSHR